MNKAKKIINLTEAHMASGLVKELYAASKNLSSKWQKVDNAINKVADVLQSPVDSENVDKVIKSMNNLCNVISDFDSDLSTLEIEVMDTRGEIQDKQGRGEL
jgi:uncharacterized protein YjgD (DUF1641 family)